MGQVLRRQFLMAASALLASPLARAQAQRDSRPFRIGFPFRFSTAFNRRIYVAAMRDQCTSARPPVVFRTSAS